MGQGFGNIVRVQTLFVCTFLSGTSLYLLSAFLGAAVDCLVLLA